MGLTINSFCKDMRRHVNGVKQSGFPMKINYLIECITKVKSAEKFFFGNEITMIDSTFDVASKKGRLFKGPVAEFIRVPYESCWFEIICPDEGILNAPIERFGFLVERVGNGHDMIAVVPFIRSIDDDNGNLIWLAPTGLSIFKTSGNWTSEDNGALANLKLIPNGVRYNATGEGHNLTVPFTPIDMVDSVVHEIVRNGLSLLQLALLMTSAKNVFLSRHDVKSKTNRKRKKKGKSILYSHHTLMTRVQNVQHKSDDDRRDDSKEIIAPLHAVEGYFSIYFRDKPLFGHLGPNNIGPIYKSEHLRGNITNGNLTKDYYIKDSHTGGAHE